MPRLQPRNIDPQFCDHPIAVKAPDDYLEVSVMVERVLESWRDSILSFEFLNKDGELRSDRELSPKNKEKRQSVDVKLRDKHAIEKPILGIGLMDNIEIGSGRDIFMALAVQGVTTMPVHIRRKQASEFDKYII